MPFFLNGTPVYTGVPFWKKTRLRKYNFCLPGDSCKTDSAGNAHEHPPPHVFQDGWSELGLVSQIAFKFLLNLDHGTHDKDLLTQAIRLKLVFAYI